MLCMFIVDVQLCFLHSLGESNFLCKNMVTTVCCTSLEFVFPKAQFSHSITVVFHVFECDSWQTRRYLTEEVYKKPVIVYNYPKDIKAFYMRLNDDGKTVAAMDVLVPKVMLFRLSPRYQFSQDRLRKCFVYLVSHSICLMEIDMLDSRYYGTEEAV